MKYTVLFFHPYVPLMYVGSKDDVPVSSEISEDSPSRRNIYTLKSEDGKFFNVTEEKFNEMKSAGDEFVSIIELSDEEFMSSMRGLYEESLNIIRSTILKED